MNIINNNISAATVFSSASYDFMHVLNPFLRIFKYCGFVPLKLQNGEVWREIGHKLQWDLPAFAFSVVALAFWIVGYAYGLDKLSRVQNWAQLRISSPIAYTAIWLNIATTFLVGLVAWITSWMKLHDLRHIFALVFEIDQKLRLHFGIKFNYSVIRVKVFLAFGLLFTVPAVFSMVNCVIVMPKSRVFNLAGSCYWFICFVPIFLFTIKEFQFVNLLWLLKIKFNKINEKIQQYAQIRQQTRTSVMFMHVASVSEMPLTPKTPPPAAARRTKRQSHDNVEANIENMKILLEAYSMAADGIELVMGTFAWHLLLTTTGAVCIITIQSYYLFAQLIEALSMEIHHIFFIVVWLFLQMIVVAININVCDAAAKTMSLTASLLHKIRVDVKYESESLFYQIVNIFSMEVLQRQNKFTAAGYFDINHKLITSMFSAVTTYLIILVQIHLASPKTTTTTI